MTPPIDLDWAEDHSSKSMPTSVTRPMVPARRSGLEPAVKPESTTKSSCRITTCLAVQRSARLQQHVSVSAQLMSDCRCFQCTQLVKCVEWLTRSRLVVRSPPSSPPSRSLRYRTLLRSSYCRQQFRATTARAKTGERCRQQPTASWHPLLMRPGIPGLPGTRCLAEMPRQLLERAHLQLR